MITDWQTYFIRYGAITCNVLSVIGASFIILTYLFWVVPHRVHNRVSTRLIVFTSLCDLGFSLSQIVQISRTSNDFICPISMWSWVFFCLCSACFTMCMAFNLQEVFLRRKKRIRKQEIFYHIFAWAAALGLSLLPFTQLMYGWDEKEQVCWFKESSTIKNILYQVFSLFLPLSLAISYSGIIFTVVAIKILIVQRRASRYVVDQDQNKSKDNSVGLAVRRLFLYPLVFVFVQFFNFVVEFNTFFLHEGNFILLFLNVTTIGMQGFLNACVFSFDTAIRGCYVAVWRKIKTCCAYPFRRRKERNKNKLEHMLNSVQSEDDLPQTRTSEDEKEEARLLYPEEEDDDASGYQSGDEDPQQSPIMLQEISAHQHGDAEDALPKDPVQLHCFDYHELPESNVVLPVSAATQYDTVDLSPNT